MKNRIYMMIAVMLSSALITAGCSGADLRNKSAAEAAAEEVSDDDDGGPESSPVESTEDGKSDTESEEGTGITYTSYSSGDASTTKGIQIMTSGDYSEKAMQQEIDEGDIDTYIEISGTSATVDGDGASAKDGTVTISKGGVYQISGSGRDVRILVSAEDEKNVRLILAGVDIEGSSESLIYAEKAKNLYINLKKGTENRLVSGAAEPEEAVIDGDADIIINGTGSLYVKGEGDCIHTSDDLQVTGGIITLEAGDDAMVGKDSVEICTDGSIDIKAGGDGIKASKDDDDKKGYMILDKGDITISAEEKGIKSFTYILINEGTLEITKCKEGMESLNIIQNGGDVTITSDDDSVNVTDKRAGVSYNSADAGGAPAGGQGAAPAGGQGFDPAGMGGSMVSGNRGPKGGMKQGEGTGQAGGIQQVDGAQQAGDGRQMQKGQGFSSPMGGRGMGPGGQSPDGMQMPQDGQMPEGMQQQQDGQRPQGMQQGDGQFPGGGGHMGSGIFEDLDGAFVMNGGTLVINNGGDGIDSNGDMIINGGTIKVNGPGSPSNTAFDYNGLLEINGGDIETYDGSENGTSAHAPGAPV